MQRQRQSLTIARISLKLPHNQTLKMRGSDLKVHVECAQRGRRMARDSEGMLDAILLTGLVFCILLLSYM